MAVAPDQQRGASAPGKPLALWVVPVAGLGGVARHVLDTAEAGIPGFNLAVLAPAGPLVEELRKRGVRVAVGKFGPDAGPLASIRTLRTAAARLRPTVVHSHLAYADVIVAATPLPVGTIRVTTEHGIAGDDQVYHRTAAKSRVMARVHSLRLRRFDSVIAVAEATKQAMLAKWAPRQHIHVIYNGVDQVERTARPADENARLRVLALARLAPEKRIPQLLRAFRLVLASRPDAQLVIAGVGELEGELKAMAVQFGIDHAVAFPGFVDPDAAMADADVLAQLSAWENCSYSLLDAANQGLRVVASNVGGNPEIVDARGLVDANDVPAVAAALLNEGGAEGLGEWPSVGDMTRSVAKVYRGAGASQGNAALPTHITLATNNGDIGGGEVMLLNIAEALRSLGVSVTVVGPSEPGALAAAARAQGFQVIELLASGRREWMAALREWDATERSGLLWCNGLVPAFATAFHSQRIVHLHQRPTGAQRLLEPIARLGARDTLVPSRSMQAAVAGATLLPNWSAQVDLPRRREREPSAPFVLGFLGRFSVDKGVPVLADALAELERSQPGRYRLRMAGEPRFVSTRAKLAVETSLAPVRDLVDFTGWASREDFLASIDLLVVPSIWPEPFGLVVTEAMSARVPVLVSDAGALPEVLGADADVFEAGNPTALAAAIVRKTARGPEGNVEQNYVRWQQHFSPKAGAVAVARVLDEI